MFAKLIFNILNTVAPSFLIGSSSFLAEARITIISQLSDEFAFRLDRLKDVGVSYPCMSEKKEKLLLILKRLYW